MICLRYAKTTFEGDRFARRYDDPGGVCHRLDIHGRIGAWSHLSTDLGLLDADYYIN
jgi:hypothetical protein